MGRKEWYTGGGEEESGAAIRRRSFNSGDSEDAEPWSQDDQGGQQCQQGLDKENQEIQGQTHKAGLFTAFWERWRRIPFKPASRFSMRSEFPGWTAQHQCQILSTCSFTKKWPSKPPLTKIHKEKRRARSVQYLKQDFNLVFFTDEMRATLDGPDGWSRTRRWVAHGRAAPTRHSNNSKMEMAWWSGPAS